jgi:hypothetical protein
LTVVSIIVDLWFKWVRGTLQFHLQFFDQGGATLWPVNANYSFRQADLKKPGAMRPAVCHFAFWVVKV